MGLLYLFAYLWFSKNSAVHGHKLPQNALNFEASELTFVLYRQFNIQHFMFCTHRSIFEFCVDLRTISVYYPIQN